MLILTDLDDTLFQTARKCPQDAGELAVMSYLAGGEESGYATQRQQRMISWLHQGHLVPVTARSREVLSRVNIRQTPAICANGGCILTADGAVDQEWHSRLTSKARENETVDDTYIRMTASLTDDRFRHWIVNEGDFPLYIVIKSNSDDDGMLANLENQLAEHKPAGWRTHRNGNNLAYLPPWLNKRNAAKFVIEQFRSNDPHMLVIGIGDSHSDVGFMDLCDFAMTPTSSQVWKGFTKENSWC